MFYPVEKLLARHTDALITINAEDYGLASKKFKTNVYFVPGELVDETKFDFKMSAKEKLDLRKSLGLSKDSIVAIYPAELSKRKRQEWLIKSLRETVRKHSELHLLLPGKDSLDGSCQKLVRELRLENNVHFLGYRKDMPKLLKIADIAVSASSQEGLPVNIIEAMINGLPIVATDSRGNRDLIKDGVNGYLIDKNDNKGFSLAVLKFMKDGSSNRIAREAKQNSLNYSLGRILPKITKIYGLEPFENMVSVVIPAYNAEGTIRRALDSVLKQTASENITDIIVVNDGSTDSTKQVVNDYIKQRGVKHPEIKLTNFQFNQGVSSARNLGISKSKSDWIALLDSDDYWLDNKLELQLEAIKTIPAIKIIGCNSQYTNYAHGRKTTGNVYEVSFMGYMLRTFPSTCSMLINKGAIQESEYFDESQKHAEDANLFMKIAHKHKIYYLKDSLLRLDDKATFGDSGLSSNLEDMHLGCIKNINEAYELGYLNISQRLLLAGWEDVRYVRRIILTYINKAIISRGSKI